MLVLVGVFYFTIQPKINHPLGVELLIGVVGGGSGN